MRFLLIRRLQMVGDHVIGEMDRLFKVRILLCVILLLCVYACNIVVADSKVFILVAIHHSSIGIHELPFFLLRKYASHLVVIKYGLIVVSLNHGGMRDVHGLD